MRFLGCFLSLVMEMGRLLQSVLLGHIRVTRKRVWSSKAWMESGRTEWHAHMCLGILTLGRSDDGSDTVYVEGLQNGMSSFI